MQKAILIAFILSIVIKITTAATTTTNSCSASDRCLSCVASVCTLPDSTGYLCTKTAPIKCSTKRTATTNLITNCKYYITPTAIGADYQTAAKPSLKNGCFQCDTGYFALITMDATGAYKSEACSKTAITGCAVATDYTNCDNKVCVDDLKAKTKTAYCRKCSTGFIPDGKAVTGQVYVTGAKTCAAAKTGVAGYDANCSFYAPLVGAGTTGVCYECKATYVLQAGTCKLSATNSTNGCRIQDASAKCTHCVDGKIFNGDKCGLGGKLIGFALIALAALFFN